MIDCTRSAEATAHMRPKRLQNRRRFAAANIKICTRSAEATALILALALMALMSGCPEE